MAASKPAGNAETLLVEVLTEELPPKALRRLGDAFAEQVVAEIVRHRLKDRDPKKKVYATPRRLAVLIPEVRAQALESAHSIEGPTSSNMKAVEGFSKKHKIAPESLERKQTEKGEIVVANFTMPGVQLDAVLANIIDGVLKKLPVPKVMRWGAGSAQFVRPVHGLVMLHGSRVVPGSVLGVESARRTLGHRFLSSGAVALNNAEDYEAALEKQGKVIAGFAERRAIIAAQLEKAAGGAELIVSDPLLDEITALVEAPAIYGGEFDADFLAVPEECLVLSMQQHQRYVPLRDRGTGKLLPRFLLVSNIESGQPREIIHGNERVLRARLSDAKFFYDQDRKTSLITRAERLKKVVYHNRLGSQFERVERIQKVASTIAHKLNADTKAAERAALLCKADLLTEMVGEFPELQGTMGSYYAFDAGEPKEIAEAIEQHYRPRLAGDLLPAGAVPCSVALADKLVSLVGLFGIGEEPTGEKDPFGLRRAALGLIRIVVEKDLPLHLSTIISSTFETMPQLKRVDKDVVEFIYERFAGYLKDLGFSTLQVDAVLVKQPDYLNLVPRQLEAVKAFQSLPEAESLAAANKRVANILRQAEAKGESFTNAEPGELTEPAERALSEAIRSTSAKAGVLYDTGDYAGYLTSFSVLKAPVDAFFDKVMVMVDDPKVRRSRLALLHDLREAMNRFADISRLAA